MVPSEQTGIHYLRMKRRTFLSRAVCGGSMLFIPSSLIESMSFPSETCFNDEDLIGKDDIIPAPDNPDEWAGWREKLHSWRNRKRSILEYDGSSYLSEPFRWASSDFACGFIMICDSDFYDNDGGRYRIPEMIRRGKEEYGGYDSVVIWHAYPRIGLDERNQFDFYREMPGGLPGVKNAINQFHNAGIKVFIDYNPWDTGTRREEKEDIDLLIQVIRAVSADGIFLDTMKDAPGFRQKLDEVKKGIVLEGEIALPVEHIQTHHMSWAQWFSDSNVPGVYRNKWFERHHMQHAIARWSSDKTPLLQTAWMNGSGMLIWENVFGQWLGWCERDKSAYRLMHSVQKFFTDIFSGDDWIPLSEKSDIPGVYISTWGNDGYKIRTLINRKDSPAEGKIFRIENNAGNRHFNLMTGEEVKGSTDGPYLAISGKIAARGSGCFLSVKSEKIDRNLTDFLDVQKRLAAKGGSSTQIPAINIVRKNPLKHARLAEIPESMIIVPPALAVLKMEYRFREPGGYGNIREYLKLAETHELHSVCTLTRHADIRKFAIDETPVTNLQFRQFLDQTGYRPAVDASFLKHWKDGRIPEGRENHPVVYVDLSDARAYAGWAGKRLPSEEEWQYAAEGPEALIYPWGNEMETGKCNDGSSGDTTNVKRFPGGRSPFGCLDMCGNVWEMTASEYTDGRTRFIMLKGGSWYKAKGSEWYFDGGPQKNSFLAKMLLIWPGLDRCSTVGFRCAADLKS